MTRQKWLGGRETDSLKVTDCQSDKNIRSYEGLFSFKGIESTIPRVSLKWFGVGHIIPSLKCIPIIWSIAVF